MRSAKELYDLSGRVALITGGAGHIGSAMADALAEFGAKIMLLDIDETRAQAQASEISARHATDATGLVVDLEDEAALREVPEKAVACFGRLDILVNCAALVGSAGLEGWAVPFHLQGARSWRRALEVNLTAPFILAQGALEPLAASGHGSIVNVLSIYGLVGPDERLYEGTQMGNPAAYGASKAGLLQLTRHIATTAAPLVRCNAITPGGVERGQAVSFRERYISRTPMRRMAIEEDFKGAAVFLAGDASGYITGQNLIVDGGWTAW